MANMDNKDFASEVSKRACVFAEDNLPSFQARIRAGDDQIFIDDHFVQMIKAAMHIGASIYVEQDSKALATVFTEEQKKQYTPEHGEEWCQLPELPKHETS